MLTPGMRKSRRKRKSGNIVTGSQPVADMEEDKSAEKAEDDTVCGTSDSHVINVDNDDDDDNDDQDKPLFVLDSTPVEVKETASSTDEKSKSKDSKDEETMLTPGMRKSRRKRKSGNIVTGSQPVADMEEDKSAEKAEDDTVCGTSDSHVINVDNDDDDDDNEKETGKLLFDLDATIIKVTETEIIGKEKSVIKDFKTNIIEATPSRKSQRIRKSVSLLTVPESDALPKKMTTCHQHQPSELPGPIKKRNVIPTMSSRSIHNSSSNITTAAQEDQVIIICDSGCSGNDAGPGENSPKLTRSKLRAFSPLKQVTMSQASSPSHSAVEKEEHQSKDIVVLKRITRGTRLRSQSVVSSNDVTNESGGKQDLDRDSSTSISLRRSRRRKMSISLDTEDVPTTISTSTRGKKMYNMFDTEVATPATPTATRRTRKTSVSPVADTVHVSTPSCMPLVQSRRRKMSISSDTEGVATVASISTRKKKISSISDTEVAMPTTPTVTRRMRQTLTTLPDKTPVANRKLRKVSASPVTDTAHADTPALTATVTRKMRNRPVTNTAHVNTPAVTRRTRKLSARSNT